MTHDTKIQFLGQAAAALLQLHLKDPKKWDAITVTEKLFDKFEELELEDEVNGNS